MIQDQDHQSPSAHVLTTWIDKTGTFLFYIGFVLLLLHFLALISALGNLYSPPPLFWIEQKWAVFLFTSILWLRVFSTIIVHKPDCRHQALYLLVFLVSVLSLWYSHLTLPLLSILLYPSQLVLDAHLPPKKQEDLTTTSTVQMESPPSLHQEPAILSRENTLQSFNQTERTIRRFPVRLPDYYQEQVADVLFRLFGAEQRAPMGNSLVEQHPLFAEGLAIARMALDQAQLALGKTEATESNMQALQTAYDTRIAALEARLLPRAQLSEEQSEHIADLVKQAALVLAGKLGGSGNIFGTIYGQLYRTFNVTSYKNLNQAQYPKAVAWLEKQIKSYEN